MTPELQDDELLRSYLLGKLPDEDADRLERRLLAEDDLFDLAEAVEFDLLAAVDRGTFTAGERDQILRKLAGSPGGRERLALARSLNALAAEKARNGNVKPFLRRAPTFPPPMIHWIALAASLVVLAGLSWFAWHNREHAPKIETHLGATSPVPTPQFQLPTPAPQPSTISLTPKPPQPTPNRLAQRREPPPAVPTAVLTLLSTTLRGEEERSRLELAPNIRQVEIQFGDEGLGDARSFDAVVRNQDQGSVVWEKKGLRLGALPGGRGLALKIPERLPAGRYEVAVTSHGEEVVTKEFEVVEAQH
ncbi:MAG TPA: hypothetical protein VLV54_09480 [Thermoanaerobaculia bacterium]|nr:hypothetical protein [Thermoanaerobaculia bacterium]